MNAISMESKICRASLLRDLLVSLGTQARQERETGRLPGLHEAAFLLAFVRQLQAQGWAVEEGIALSCSEDARTRMRVLRDTEATARSSRERGLGGQHPVEPPNRGYGNAINAEAATAWIEAYLERWGGPVDERAVA